MALQRGVKILLGLVLAALVADLAVTSLVGAGAIDPARYSVGSEERPLVVSSTTFLDDMVLRIAGDTVRRELIVGPGGDPHVYQPTPRDQVAIERAGLIVLNGYGLEPRVEEMAASVRTGHNVTIDAAKGLDPFYEPYAGKTVPDPHMWLSVPRAKVYVDNILAALVAMSPENARLYEANAQVFKMELDLVDASVRETIGTIPPENRKLVTTHDAFRYFGNEYGITVVDTVWGVTTDTEPTPEDVRELVEALRAQNVPAVFIESSVNPKLLEQAAAEAGVRIGGSLYSDSLGLPGSGAHTYSSMMLANARILANGLGGASS